MKILIAPIHLDAMLLTHPKVVKEALANYALLPYTDTSRDYNPDTPYLGESIVNHPFQDENLLLKAGAHLHWSLPKGLSKTVGVPLTKKDDLNSLASFFPDDISSNSTQWAIIIDTIWQSVLLASGWIKLLGDNENMASIMEMTTVNKDIFNEGIALVQIAGNLTEADTLVSELTRLMTTQLGGDYPAVPNVWLITRKDNTKPEIELAWVVESNYISESQSETQGNIGSVNVPFHDDNHDNKSQPFRYLGRRQPLDDSWVLNQLDHKHFINEVTAVGYNPQKGSKGFGEPTFAAFYPNCLSVFGFYDPNPLPNRTYEVMGIYSENKNDYFKNFIKDFYNRYSKGENFFDKLNEIIKNEFQWEISESSQITLNEDDTVPERTILYGKAIPKTANVPNPNDMHIAVGNTGTEALSAYLASNIQNGENKIVNEEILESIQFASKLQNQILDIGHKFEEARHDKGFTAFDGGTIWSLKLETINDGETPPQTSKKNSEAGIENLNFPDVIAVLLNEVNKLQFDLDRKLRETPFLRRQLFSDWSKYMLSSYPSVDNTTFHFDNDELLNYIRKNSIQPLQENIDHHGSVSIAKDGQGRFKDVIAKGEENSLAFQLAEKLKQLNAELNTFNNQQQADEKSWKEKGKCLALRQGSAPRYWRAKDPVILFAEKPSTNEQNALTNDRHKDPVNAEPTICNIIDITDTNFSEINKSQLDEIYQAVRDLYSDDKDTNLGESDEIWNPFMMEWEVEFLPALPKSNQGTDDKKYDSEYVNAHYKLGETDPDFTLISSVEEFQNANIYKGSTILTPSAGISLDKTINQFIKDHGESQPENTLEALTEAQTHLMSINVLSQSLGGFHDALVMQKQTRQLDIADPLGFPEYQSFAKNEVSPLVEKFNLTSPIPLAKFNPIRSGVLNLLSLRLIDTFGQTIDFDTTYFDENHSNVVIPETLTLGELHSGIHLKPRLTQPARINFRLLSGVSDEEEMNDDPISSPICGWLMPNHLDRSVMIYDHDGMSLGALTMNAAHPWRPSPGGETNTNIDSIKNPHLRRVVNYLMNRQVESIDTLETTDNSFLLHFLKALDSAFENIDPENFAEHQDLAVLMGRPVAVIRTKLNLELEHPPTTDQSWTQLHHELEGHGRSSDNFTKVKFPIRLGEHKQLNDGLFGYWLENEDGSLGQNYYSSEASENSNPYIKTFNSNNEDTLNIFRSLDDDPINITMLADPRGCIQVITGILPIKSITIPSDQYKEALRNISVTFLTAPILSPIDHLKISLPKEADYEWSWLEVSKDGEWSETLQSVIINKSLLDSKFPDEPTLWNRLIAKKWLEPLVENSERALITSAVHRAFPPSKEIDDTDPLRIELGKRVDEFFDAYGKRIEPFDSQVSFNGSQTIREGWLKLGKAR